MGLIKRSGVGISPTLIFKHKYLRKFSLKSGGFQPRFVTLINHGVPPSVAKDGLAASRRFFEEFSLEDKMRFRNVELPGMRMQGYIGPGDEAVERAPLLKGENDDKTHNFDCKEAFNIRCFCP